MSCENPTIEAAPRKSGMARWAVLVVLVGVIVASYALGLDRRVWQAIQENLGRWQTRVDENVPLAVAVYFAIYVTATALSLPAASLISLVGGALFGRWLGTAVVSAASTLGATLAFLASRYLLRDWVQTRFGPRLAGINRGVEQDGAFYLLTLRLVPAVPFFLINLGMGLTAMRTSTYAVVSWAGMLIGTFLYVNAGTELGKVLTQDSPRGLVSPTVIVSVALLGIIPLVVRKIVQFRRRKTDG